MANVSTEPSSSPPPHQITFGPSEDPHRYRLGRQIGAGATSKVFECVRIADGQVLAVKIMALGQVNADPDRSEVSILKRLDHRNIVKVFDAIPRGPLIYMVMEYVGEGELFNSIITDERFSEEMVVKFIFCQIVDALLYLHSNGVIHRDLKPENILIASTHTGTSEDPLPLGYPLVDGMTFYPIIKLADFGLSRVVTSATLGRATTVVGTPQYWAPEVIKSKETGAGYDGRADNWSLGVLLFVMLAKRYPFTASKKNGLSINDRIRRGEYSFNKMEDVCPKAKDLISRLIVVDPAKRITLEDALHHPWLADFPLAVKLAHTWTPTMPQTLVAELPGILSTKSSVVMPSAVEEDLSPIASEDGSVREYPVGVKIVDGGKCELPTIRSKDSAKRELLRPNADDGFGAKAAEKLRLDELCSAQMSACDLLRQVYFLLQDKPLVQDKVGAFILDARQLRHSTTAIMGRCADIAEVVETDISDMTLFVEEGVPECAVDCMASVNSKLVGMTESCEELQQGHARLAARMQKIISVLPGAASRLSQKQLQAISYYENELLDGASTDKSAQTLALLFDQLGNVSEGGSPLDSSSDIADVYDLPFLAAGHVVSKRAGSADTTTTTTSVSSEADSSTESSFGSSSSSSADPTRLVARSLAKLRRVDEILSRMSNFWASVDQSVAKLSDMRENTERLLRGATKSDRILNLFKSRAVEYQTFWREFGQSCRRYAEVMSQGSQKLTEPLEVTNLPEAASPISGRLPALNEQEA